MNKTRILSITIVAISAALFWTGAQAERVQWKLHTAWGSQVPHLGTEAVRFAEDVKRLSGGEFVLKHSSRAPWCPRTRASMRSPRAR